MMNLINETQTTKEQKKAGESQGSATPLRSLAPPRSSPTQKEKETQMRKQKNSKF